MCVLLAHAQNSQTGLGLLDRRGAPGSIPHHRLGPMERVGDQKLLLPRAINLQNPLQKKRFINAKSCTCVPITASASASVSTLNVPAASNVFRHAGQTETP